LGKRQTSFATRWSFLSATQRFDHVDEVANVVELLIDASKPDVGDVVGLGQVSHHDFANLGRRNLQQVTLVDLRLDLQNQVFDLLAADGPFAASAFDSTADFFTVQRFASLIPFDDTNERFLEPFERDELSLARAANPFPTDDITVFGSACVDDTIVIGVTEWTAHGVGKYGGKNRLLGGRFVPGHLRLSLIVTSRQAGVILNDPSVCFDTAKTRESIAVTEPPAPSNPATSSSAGQSHDRGPEELSPRERFQQSVASRQAGIGEADIEQSLWEGNYSPLAMLGYAASLAIASVALLVVSIIYGIPTIGISLAIIAGAWVVLGMIYAARRFGIHYELTTQRFIHQTGLLSRRTDRIEVIDIDDVSFFQGPVQRILGIGTIDIASSDRSHPVLKMPGIADVKQVAGLIDDVRRKERKRRSLHIQTM
jgi:membrane protein YdbS with pleckstrin-like domain